MSPRSGPLLDGDAAVQVLDGEDLASGQPDPDDTIILDGAQVEEEGAEEVQEETEQYELTPEEEVSCGTARSCLVVEHGPDSFCLACPLLSLGASGVRGGSAMVGGQHRGPQ